MKTQRFPSLNMQRSAAIPIWTHPRDPVCWTRRRFVAIGRAHFDRGPARGRPIHPDFALRAGARGSIGGTLRTSRMATRAANLDWVRTCGRNYFSPGGETLWPKCFIETGLPPHILPSKSIRAIRNDAGEEKWNFLDAQSLCFGIAGFLLIRESHNASL